MIRFRLAVAMGLLAVGCVSLPEPHIRAKECNELCAQYIGMGKLQAAEDQCDLGIEFSPNTRTSGPTRASSPSVAA